jgi:hypothetical protein
MSVKVKKFRIRNSKLAILGFQVPGFNLAVEWQVVLDFNIRDLIYGLFRPSALEISA